MNRRPAALLILALLAGCGVDGPPVAPPGVAMQPEESPGPDTVAPTPPP